ncbi:uncharacterized protein OCT59_002674 [Rhizophagus irregularis]|uniref:uncharacterized protein n=1 Tax=Rhizophagus irregularis TaxID=588596 RepID=UPI00331A47DC|nr:hypothetical protein OCT59_002674 [Rhizophagus irregularis]
MEFLSKNFANWTSGNEIFDNFIQEKQLEYVPENRPNSIEVKEIIELFYNSLDQKFKKNKQHYEIEEQFKKTQEYRKENLLSIKNNNKSTTHVQAIYTSRLLNPFTKNLFSNSTVEITDFTE